MSLRRCVHCSGRNLRLLAAAGLMSFVTLTATSTPSAQAVQGPDMFGIAMGGESQYQEATTRERELDAIQAVGSRWVRIDLTWSVIQDGGPSTYDWTEVDRIVRGITSRGMKVLGTIAYTPSWARPAGTTEKHGPDPDQYAAFAAKAVQHYAAMGVHHYEVWNEPNIGFWAPKPDPAAYTKLLKAAYPAIKGADPSATVLTGGTAPASTEGSNYSPVDFLKRIYANGGGDSFDAVAHHPYCWAATTFPGEPEEWSAWHQMEGTGQSLRSVMKANGDAAKKIWGTEYGAPTNGPPDDRVTERQQADMITKAYTLWKDYEWAGPLFIYQGRDIGTDTSTREDFFGLLRHDFSKKPSYTAYRNLVAGVGNASGAARTTIKVKGKGRRGRGSANGIVSIRPDANGAESVEPTGSVKLKLYRQARRGWRSVTRARTAQLREAGRFRKRLKGSHGGGLAPGSYRIKALYAGSPAAEPSVARSRRFKLRP